ncbi:nitrate reductase-like protein [Blastomyces dermatitidis ATCC 26199]|nr:nitrate reductase-like protein [Blastomyces dermatitidis ATCC 26199]
MSIISTHGQRLDARSGFRMQDPEPVIHISRVDAKALHLADGEMSLGGRAAAVLSYAVAIRDIAKGHVFIPFHFDYFDAKDDRARAANELTIEQWDMISKQQMFKSGAVRIEKCVQKEGTRKRTKHAKEEQTRAVENIEKNQGSAQHATELPSQQRLRFPERWMGVTHEALEMLIEMYRDLIPRLVHDLEVQSGLGVMCQIVNRSPPNLPAPDRQISREPRIWALRRTAASRRHLLPQDLYERSI